MTCPHCGNEITVPGKFGPFLLYHLQSESVTSSVFDAFDPKLGRNVTLKILNYVLSKNPELVEAFKREALAAASLNSVYVLKVYEFGIHNRQPFMVMEHIEGNFLHEVMQNETLTESQIVDFVQGIVFGLKDMHEQGIMHGDVMPRNILLQRRPENRPSDYQELNQHLHELKSLMPRGQREIPTPTNAPVYHVNRTEQRNPLAGSCCWCLPVSCLPC